MVSSAVVYFTRLIQVNPEQLAREEQAKNGAQPIIRTKLIGVPTEEQCRRAMMAVNITASLKRCDRTGSTDKHTCFLTGK